MADATDVIDKTDATADADKAADKTADTTADKTADTDKGGDKTADADAADWRARMAGDDAELSKFLGKYHSEQAALKGFRDTYGQLRSGKFIKPLGEDPKDEEVAAYRKAIGVPESVDDYAKDLPDGLVLGDDDLKGQGGIERYLKVMHDANVPKGAAAALIGEFMKDKEELAATMADAEKAAKQASEDALREEWGSDYRRNLNIVDSYLETLPADVRAAIDGGFGADGVSLKSNAGFIKFLAGLAFEANPVATVVPGSGADQASGIADEIAKIEKFMRENRPAYNKDEKMQARLRELYAARDKLAKAA